MSLSLFPFFSINGLLYDDHNALFISALSGLS